MNHLIKLICAIAVAALPCTGFAVGGTFDVPLEDESWTLRPLKARMVGKWRGSITMKTLHGGEQEGVKIITVDNGATVFTVIPTRGMSIYQVKYGGITLGWDSPVTEHVNPAFINLDERGGLGWLDGFNEWMVRCGYEFAGHPGQDGGRLLTLHGRSGNIPASKVQVVIDDKPPYTIRIRGLVQEKTFKFANYDVHTEISTTPYSNSVAITDTLHNRGEYETEYQVIYHGNYGTSILEEGAEFVAPMKEVTPFDDYAAKDMSTWTTYLGPTKGYGEQVYCCVPYADSDGQTTVMLHNKAGDQGVAVSYDTKTLPFFTLWKNTDTKSDGYVTGLEPATGYPYNRAVERHYNRVPKIAPGAKVTFSSSYTVLANKTDVDATKAAIKAIQNNRPTTKNAKPTTDKSVAEK
jgi:hypothetical protein